MSYRIRTRSLSVFASRGVSNASQSSHSSLKTCWERVSSFWGMDTTRRRYPSDLTQAEWGQVQLYPGPKPGGRPAKHDRREVVNALLYVSRTGCQWRALSHDLPPWATVYRYFRTWSADGTLDRMMAELRGDLPGATPRFRSSTASCSSASAI